MLLIQFRVMVGLEPIPGSAGSETGCPHFEMLIQGTHTQFTEQRVFKLQKDTFVPRKHGHSAHMQLGSVLNPKVHISIIIYYMYIEKLYWYMSLQHQQMV